MRHRDAARDLGQQQAAQHMRHVGPETVFPRLDDEIARTRGRRGRCAHPRQCCVKTHLRRGMTGIALQHAFEIANGMLIGAEPDGNQPEQMERWNVIGRHFENAAAGGVRGGEFLLGKMPGSDFDAIGDVPFIAWHGLEIQASRKASYAGQ